MLSSVTNSPLFLTWLTFSSIQGVCLCLPPLTNYPRNIHKLPMKYGTHKLPTIGHKLPTLNTPSEVSLPCIPVSTILYEKYCEQN